MFARLTTLVLFVLPVLAIPTEYNGSSGDCTTSTSSTGQVMCCSGAEKVDPSGSAKGIAGILTGLIRGVNLPIDVQCVPVTGKDSADGQSYTGQVACCSKNNINAPVSLKCIPVDVNA